MKILKTKKMTIGVLAKQAGVGVETIRFYQRQGLLRLPDRGGGFRTYSSEDVKKIHFIKHAQALGFSLKYIKELLLISICNPKTQPYLEKICQDKIAEINSKINELTKTKALLCLFLQSCGKKHPKEMTCDLVACFEKKWACCQPGNKGVYDE